MVAAAHADGDLRIGCVLVDGWVGVDLDGVLDGATGAIADEEVAA